jgi:5-methylcytosine-specific restriction enzyme A
VFTVGAVYSRQSLHKQYGGQLYRRISTPAHHPVIFLFADDPVGEAHYLSGWTSYGVFRFIGEGRYGHMTFTRGNRALRYHQTNGKGLHLFLRQTPTDPDTVCYQGQMRYSAHFYKEGNDLNHHSRRMIVFLLKHVSV